MNKETLEKCNESEPYEPASESERKKHFEICKKCPERKALARMADVHVDWLDCPYDCENNYEHYKKRTKK